MKLSVIIPIYNVENYLRRCLDSAIDLDLSDYEIVAVNDGSTDGSPAIAEEYASRYPGLFHLITTANGGLGHARNVGLSLAKGEFVLFLDSDDRLSPGALPEMLALLADDFDICFFDFITEDEQGRELSLTPGCNGPERFSLASYPELLFDRPNAWNKIWRRSLFSDCGVCFPDRMWYEDLATSPKLYLNTAKMRYVPKAWYRYLLRSGSITNSRNTKRNLEIISAVDSVLEYFRSAGAYEQYKPQLEYMAVYHQLLTASTRVNGIDWKTDVQEALLQDFLKKFPHFYENPYVKAESKKYRFLLHLIVNRRRWMLHQVMRANSIVKRRST